MTKETGRKNRRGMGTAKGLAAVAVFSMGLLGLGVGPMAGAAEDLGASDEASFVRGLLDMEPQQQARLEAAQAAGLLELAPVNLPTDPKGDNNHFGWPVATMAGDTMIVVHRAMPGHNKKLAGSADQDTTYSTILRSKDGGKTWSEPYDVRECMTPEDRNRGGSVPLVHRFKFDPENKSPLGYKLHLNALGTLRDGAVLLVSDHGVFRSEDQGATWSHLRLAFREDRHEGPFAYVGPRIIDDPAHGTLLFAHHSIVKDGRPSDIAREIAVYRSRDRGETWEKHRLALPDWCKPAEPDVIPYEEGFVAIIRNQRPVDILAQARFTFGDTAITDVANTNMKTKRSVDTSAICFNPVTNRFEVVQSKREDMSINLYSIAPEDWATAAWRFEGRLFKRGGKFYATADGFHTGGAVMDVERGAQHVFFYCGAPGGPAGAFRLTRSLDTPALSAVLKGEAQAPVGIAFRPATEPLFQLDYPAPTADKPQSKLWHMDGCWWALLPRESGPSLWQRTDTGWVEHPEAVQGLERTARRADVWPGVSGVTAVGLEDYQKTNTSVTVFRLTRVGEGGASRWENQVLAELAPPSPEDVIETATIMQDTAGRWWVAAVAGVKVCVWTAPEDGTLWSGPIVLAERVAPDDICVVTPLPGKKTGVIWSDQVREGFLVRAHADGAATGAWNEEAPIQLGGRIGDDHLNTVLAPGGAVWLATKNSVDAVGKGQFTLFEGDPDGTWRSWPFGILGETTRPSRPIVVSSADGGTVFIGYGDNDRALPSPHGARIVFSRMVPAVPDGVEAPRTVIAPDPVHNSFIQNVTGPRHAFPADAPWIILASDKEGRVYEADLRAAFPEGANPNHRVGH